MKSGIIFLGVAACVALCACTDNDIIGSSGNSDNQVFTGNVAYMIVNIGEVGSTTTKAESSGYAKSNTEHDIKDVNFYFYDSNGSLETHASGWSDMDGTAGYVKNNIEFTSNKIVILSGIANQNFPSYVVTVINKPDGFTAPLTLDAMGEALTSASKIISSGDDNTEYFTMSTSSYFDYSEGSNHDNTYYFATPLTDDNFTTEPIEGDDYDIPKPVEIYVERLAVKARLTTLLGDHYWYRGDEIDELGPFKRFSGDSQTVPIIEDEEDFTKTTDEAICISLDGWAINATEKQSYLVKHIDSSWIDYAPWTSWDGDSWNDADNYRSYWCKSVHYGDNTVSYPTSAEFVDGSEVLNYICANDLTNSIGSDHYCAENTNTVGDIITNENSSAISSFILKATAMCIRGNDADAYMLNLDIVDCDGVLYFSDVYLAYALSKVLPYSPIYVYDEDNDATLIDKSYLEMAKNGYDGKAKVAIISTDEEGNEITYYSDENGTTIDAEDVQTLIDNEFNNFYGSDANWYKDGQMYYNIPIQHLNNPEGDDIEEAQYGVVRNHYYVATITELNNLGRGIIDPEEPIIPQTESTKYYIGAEVNILAWKEVDISVAF